VPGPNLHAPLPAIAERVLAPLWRRLFALLYETLLLVAVLWAAGFLYTAIVQHLGLAPARICFQGYLVAVAGAYFAIQWTRGGQTLAMKTWRLRLVRSDGGAVGPARALGRYGLALAGLALFGTGFLWALVDRERQFLHDRLADTRIVRTDV
jgi:uncharacterized RDD family membrane protein YckC